ncbi:hypothetical protein [Dongia sp.]|uniref:hypothetical protein n=1 Tax=Dongia sp. TaxID=1977262 RepID=UPI0035B00E2C
MMKKDDCEKAIRGLCHDWGREVGIARAAESDPSFSQFKTWLHAKGYSHYLNFRSSISADYDAEQWFIQEFKQGWRY